MTNSFGVYVYLYLCFIQSLIGGSWSTNTKQKNDNAHQLYHINTRFHIMNIYWSQVREKINFPGVNISLFTILEGVGKMGQTFEKD